MTNNNKRAAVGIIISCLLAYTFSMCLKKVYSSSMVVIKDEYGISHSVASLPITLYFILYAVIQIFLAKIMKKINMKLYMLITFLFSGLSFVSVFFFSPVWYVCSVMAINGLTLGAVWCGSVMTFSTFLTKKQMSDTLLIMSAGSAIGNTLSYGISALSMHVGNWRLSFLIVGFAFLFSAIYMIYSITRAEKMNLVPDEDDFEKHGNKDVYTVEKYEAKPLIIMATIVVFFSCILYYAFSTWMPTILKNVFSMSNAQATLITTALPVAVFTGAILANYLSNKMKNDFLLTTLSASIVMVLSLLLCFGYDVSILMCVALIGTLGIVLRLINALNCSLVALHTKDHFNSGSTASIINSSACVAAGVSPALIAMILDISGGNWKTGFVFLFIVSIVLTLVPLSFLAANGKRRKKIKSPN